MEKRKCPYCGEEMVPGKICARESTGLLFRASCAPRFLKNYELGVTKKGAPGTAGRALFQVSPSSRRRRGVYVAKY